MQAVIRMAGFVDAVFVNDDRADKAAELDQRMPVAAVARQAGGLDREDRSGAPLADCRQKALEARPGDAGARAPEIIVDDHDVLPAQLPRAFRKTVLTPPAFVIVQHLVSGRLTNVDKGAARQGIRCDLGHHRSPCSLSPSLVFSKFAEFQSMRQVHLWFRQEHIALPVVRYSAEEGR